MSNARLILISATSFHEHCNRRCGLAVINGGDLETGRIDNRGKRPCPRREASCGGRSCSRGEHETKDSAMRFRGGVWSGLSLWAHRGPFGTTRLTGFPTCPFRRTAVATRLVGIHVSYFATRHKSTIPTAMAKPIDVDEFFKEQKERMDIPDEDWEEYEERMHHENRKCAPPANCNFDTPDLGCSGENEPNARDRKPTPQPMNTAISQRKTAINLPELYWRVTHLSRRERC
jgi:hypothetical protein